MVPDRVWKVRPDDASHVTGDDGVQDSRQTPLEIAFAVENEQPVSRILVRPFTQRRRRRCRTGSTAICKRRNVYQYLSSETNDTTKVRILTILGHDAGLEELFRSTTVVAFGSSRAGIARE